jgi:hypothetical protein
MSVGSSSIGDMANADDGSDWLTPLLTEAADGLEAIVAKVVVGPDHEAAAVQAGQALLKAIEATNDLDDGDDAAGIAVATAHMTLIGWLVGARDDGIDPIQAMTWVRGAVDDKIARKAVLDTAGLIGHPSSDGDLTISELFDRWGPVTYTSLILLAAGVAATAGAGDAHWLRQFDPEK